MTNITKHVGPQDKIYGIKYMGQIFQSLDYDFAKSIENFLIEYCKNSQLFAHQLIWLSRVESKIDADEKNPVDPSINQQKREYALLLPSKIIKNMTMQEKKFWEEEDNFFEQITDISSI